MSYYQVANPLQSTINDAEQIIARVDDIAAELETCIAAERKWLGHYRDALENYEHAELEALAEVVTMAAVAKEGPLGGIAASSKAYDIILNNLKNQLRRNQLAELWRTVDNLKRSYEIAQVELAQVETRFKALRTVAEVKTQVLRASTI